MPKTKKPLIQWQLPMIRVLYALIPITIASIYFFGWRVLVMLLLVNIAGFFTEYTFTRAWNEPVSSAVFVTNFLFCLCLPPILPLWMAVIGIVVAVTCGKMVFGGFGRNIFNPALVGRAFLYICFPAQMTIQWAHPVRGALGGFGVYTTDALTSATPLVAMKAQEHVEWIRLFLGNVSGSVGETSALLIIIGGLYIVWKKAADFRIVVSGIVALFTLQGIFWLLDIRNAVDPISAILSGSFLFGIFFFATEPVSAPRTKPAKWMFGAFVTVLTVLIRTFSVWNEGMMFAVLLGNMFAPITDYAIESYKTKKKPA